MRKRPTPTTLYDAALQRAQDDLAHRQRELKAMRASLALLDELAPSLKERGFELFPGYLTWWAAQRAITLSLGLFAGKGRYAALFDTLVGMGFKVVVHKNQLPSYSEAVLKRGRLALRLSDLPPLPEPEKTTDADEADKAAWSAGA
jgi:hypothetical protein